MDGSKRPEGSKRSRGSRGVEAALLVLACAALFWGLGETRLWSDEGDTAVFARTIASRGLPYAWDGTTFTDSDAGRRIGPGLVMVGTPWLPFYVTAASFALFGESAFTARLPFAAAGLATLVLLYSLVLRVTGDRRAALLSAVLLGLNVQFLLFARQCRHYALNMLLGVALVSAFLRMREHPRDPWLVVVVVLLFHTHPLPAGAGLAALGALTFLHPGFRDLRVPLLWRAPFVALLTLPWMALALGGWDENSTFLTDSAELLPRLGQLAIEASVAIPYLAWLVLLPWVWRRFTPDDRAWLALMGAHLAAYAVLAPLLLSVGELWVVGLRYVCALLPFAAGVTGLLVARSGGVVLQAGLVGLLGFTHLGGNTLPWLLLGGERPPGPTRSAVHEPVDGVGSLVRLEWPGFVNELREPPRGSVSAIVEWLDANAAPGDGVVTNYAWDPIYFHTGLPMLWRLLPDSPVYEEARRAGLPTSVFGPEGARFVVWRRVWGSYPGIDLADVTVALAARGERLELAARLPETVWESRPGLHFRRFPGLGHLYRGAARERYPDLEIYRVVPDSWN